MKITIKVVPNARTPKIVLDKTGTLKCYVSSPPQDGKANQEVIKLFADKLALPRRNVTIVVGLTSRTKILAIDGFVDKQQLLNALGLPTQNSFL